MAPRKRIRGPEWLPVRCYVGKAAYEYRPRSGGCVRLAGLTADKAIVMANYYHAVSLHQEKTGDFSQLVREYFTGANYLRLATRTKRDYANYSERVLKIFGSMNRHRIKPHHIRQYMDKRAVDALTQANREHSFLSAVFSWGYENGKVKVNPCVGVRKFYEPPRDRYIEDWEYQAVLAEAYIKWPLLAATMEISYCCAARQADVWALTREQLREQGIYIKQGKTGVKQIKEWNPRLRAAVDLALSVQTVPNFKLVFCDAKGNHPAQGTMRNWYDKARQLAKDKHDGEWNSDFTFHDIKARAISDFDGDKQNFSGHKTEAQVRSYDRKVKVTPTLK
jgi:hypothetical protein